MPLRKKGAASSLKTILMNRMKLLLPAVMICGWMACHTSATQSARDTTANASHADSTVTEAPTGAARDTFAKSEYGLPDTLTIGSQLYRVVPSTEELFESAPEFRPDTAESKNIARQADRVRREGGMLIFKLGNGSEKSLGNIGSDGEDFEEWVYQGYLPQLKSFVVWKNGYEYFDVQLLNEQTGELTRTIGLPQVSPDGKKMIACNTDLMAAFTTNGLEYYANPPEGLVLQYEYQPEKWGPEVIKWLDNNVLVGKFNVLTKDMDQVVQYVRLEPVR